MAREVIADSEAAPAKINLALHVVGRRADGYHRLDSLVVHGGAEDRVSARTGSAGSPLPSSERGTTGDADAPLPRLSLTITGPFAAGLTADPDNLVLRAARRLAEEAVRLGAHPGDVDLMLEKNLPIASGIGGGSSDAAATLRLLDRLWRLDLGRDRLATLALPLGADVPMCVDGRPARIGGIGEEIAPIEDFPPLALVLVNPGVAVSTPAVFRALTSRDNPPMPPLPARFRDAVDVADWLGATRNDLEPAAIAVAPKIGQALDLLRRQPGCLIARMSGSGATCFGLFRQPVPSLDRLDAGWWSTAA